MATIDKEKFVKVLRLTTSNVDGEALSAIRAANKMLLNAGLDWSQVVMTGGDPNLGNIKDIFDDILRGTGQRRKPMKPEDHAGKAGNWQDAREEFFRQARKGGYKADNSKRRSEAFVAAHQAFHASGFSFHDSDVDGEQDVLVVAMGKGMYYYYCPDRSTLWYKDGTRSNKVKYATVPQAVYRIKRAMAESRRGEKVDWDYLWED